MEAGVNLLVQLLDVHEHTAGLVGFTWVGEDPDVILLLEGVRVVRVLCTFS